MFYEQIEGRPPLHLRLLLPVPTGAEGKKWQLGDEAKCLYKGGHLVKRITQIDPGQHYGFEIVEQALKVGGGMQIAGGAYTLRQFSSGSTEVTLSTRYVSPKRPRWFWKLIEAAVCHGFHRHILTAIGRNLEAR